MLEKSGRHLGVRRINRLIYSLSDVIVVPVVDTNLLEVLLLLHVCRILIDLTLGHLNWI